MPQFESKADPEMTTQPPLRDLNSFDYTASAELFPNRSRNSRRLFGYKRFDNAAEAIRFIVEELPVPAMVGAYLEVDDARFMGDDVRRLYERAEYPLPRRAS